MNIEGTHKELQMLRLRELLYLIRDGKVEEFENKLSGELGFINQSIPLTIRNGKESLSKYNNYWSMLAYAIANKQIEIVKILLKNNVNIDANINFATCIVAKCYDIMPLLQEELLKRGENGINIIYSYDFLSRKEAYQNLNTFECQSAILDLDYKQYKLMLDMVDNQLRKSSVIFEINEKTKEEYGHIIDSEELGLL